MKTPELVQLFFPTFWIPMKLAPKDNGELRAMRKDGEIVIIHWAEDLSGEEQLPFRGWFKKVAWASYQQVTDLIGWKPLTEGPDK